MIEIALKCENCTLAIWIAEVAIGLHEVDVSDAERGSDSAEPIGATAASADLRQIAETVCPLLIYAFARNNNIGHELIRPLVTGLSAIKTNRVSVDAESDFLCAYGKLKELARPASAESVSEETFQLLEKERKWNFLALFAILVITIALSLASFIGTNKSSAIDKAISDMCGKESELRCDSNMMGFPMNVSDDKLTRPAELNL